MKKTRIALAICFALLIPIGAHSQRTFAPGGIIDPRLIGPTDPDYAPPFFIGPLVFKVPNRFLIFPWPRGQHPFDRSLCAEPTAVKDPAVIAICKSDHQSVFLKIPIPGFAWDVQNNGAISLVTLGFHELMGSKWPGYQGSVEEYSAEYDDRWVRMHVTELDTKKYVAFHDAWTGAYAKQAPPNILAEAAGEYVFISKSIKDQPRALNCQTVLNTGDVHHKVRCNATIPFLSEQYPQEPSGRYPYTISFDLPGDEIDAAAEVGRRVTQAVLAFLYSPASAH
jgi:hypothetical protein